MHCKINDFPNSLIINWNFKYAVDFFYVCQWIVECPCMTKCPECQIKKPTSYNCSKDSKDTSVYSTISGAKYSNYET